MEGLFTRCPSGGLRWWCWLRSRNHASQAHHLRVLSLTRQAMLMGLCRAGRISASSDWSHSGSMCDRQLAVAGRHDAGRPSVQELRESLGGAYGMPGLRHHVITTILLCIAGDRSLEVAAPAVAIASSWFRRDHRSFWRELIKIVRRRLVPDRDRHRNGACAVLALGRPRGAAGRMQAMSSSSRSSSRTSTSWWCAAPARACGDKVEHGSLAHAVAQCKPSSVMHETVVLMELPDGPAAARAVRRAPFLERLGHGVFTSPCGSALHADPGHPRTRRIAGILGFAPDPSTCITSSRMKHRCAVKGLGQPSVPSRCRVTEPDREPGAATSRDFFPATRACRLVGYRVEI